MTVHGLTDPSPSAPDLGATLGSEVEQVYDLFTGTLQAWSAYWAVVLSARGVDDILRANVDLVAESFNLAGLAAARRQSVHGEIIPTLNEA